MSNVTEALTRKLGPLPAWAYGLGLGLGIVGYRRWKDRKTAAAPVTAEDQAAADLQAAQSTGSAPGDYVPGSVGGYQIPAALANAGGQPYVDQSSAQASQGGPGDNAAWKSQAVERLVGRLGYDPTGTADALENYLQGSPINAQQESIVGAAIRALGVPPDGAPPILRGAPSSTAAASPPQQPGTPSSVAVPLASAPPPYSRPGWLGSARFVKGSGPAVYLVTDQGREWIPSEAALHSLGGINVNEGPNSNVLQVADSALAAIPVIGTRPPPGTDASI